MDGKMTTGKFVDITILWFFASLFSDLNNSPVVGLSSEGFTCTLAIFQEKLKQFEERLAEERHNRLEERKRQRKEERRISYYREKEEEEQRLQEEKMLKGKN